VFSTTILLGNVEQHIYISSSIKLQHV